MPNNLFVVPACEKFVQNTHTHTHTHTHKGLLFVAQFTRPQHYAIQKLPIKNTMLSAHFLGIHYNRRGSGKEKGGMVWNTTTVLDFQA
jgi:hypothetical protein